MTKFNNILLATDFGDSSALAMAAAFEIANGLGATVHALHVFTLQDNMQAENFSQVDLAELQQQATSKFEALASTCDGVGRLGRVISHFGDPAALVLLTAEELSADLIVLGSHGRQGISRLLLGSVAETVMRKARCPVLVAKSTSAPSEEIGTPTAQRIV